jgi:DNA-binding MurR/RpiR family transcriptional regulator
MGYSGFKDFKISMAQGYSSYNEYFFHTDAENNATELQALIRKTLYSESHVIETTMRFLDETLLEAASRQLIASRRICLFGVGTSFTICNDAQRKLTRLGLSVWTYNEFHSSMMLISTMNENDVVFCISHSGITPETGEILKIAHAKGIHTILMTSFPNTPMCKYAQIILRTYGQEVSTNRTAMTSRIGQLAVVDALYVTLVHLMGEDVVNFMEQTVRDTYQR